MFTIDFNNGAFTLRYRNIMLIEHEASRPWMSIGRGNPSIDFYRGNFFIEDHIEESIPLYVSNCNKTGDGAWDLRFSDTEKNTELGCRIYEEAGRLKLAFSGLTAHYNRFVLHLKGEATEHIYGCGEQFSYLDLKGRNFPLWTQEQGVGRNKTTEITKTADRLDRAGGDYHTTFYPQPTYVSSRGYFFHAETYAYADFDFSAPDDIKLSFWDLPAEITLGSKGSLMETVQDISAFLGRQGPLPGWAYDGVILGIQGGTETCRAKLRAAQAAGVPVAGIWAQDWEGERYTSFGKRLRWNWQWDPQLYPGLDVFIRELREEGIRFLGYINCNLLEGAPLFNEAKEKGYLVRNESGDVLLVDFGEFNGGIVDITDEKALAWYKGVIRTWLIDFGLSGWMADFGEYLPIESVPADNSSAMLAHNRWPGLWAQVNHEAAAESGRAEDLLFFMRAGNARSLSQCQLLFTGDQNVDWSEDDGLPSALTGTLQAAMSGHGLDHSDIGGYTTLYGLRRSKELFLRWAEFAAFSPLMRTHEGNRPSENWQFDSDAETLAGLAKAAKIHAALKPYIKDAVAQNAEKGIPVMAPVFLYFPVEPFFTCKDQYMFGSDILAAPVLEEGAVSRKVRLPENDTWVHLFTGEVFRGGLYDIAAPLGIPPVFYRKASKYSSLFSALHGRPVDKAPQIPL